MFTLHIYNPEHDIALGRNDTSFTPPRAARMTKERFWYVPAYLAKDGDMVLVESTTVENTLSNKVRFVTWMDLAKLTEEDMPNKVEPWGWDKLIVSQLLKCNPLFKALVPSDEELDDIRRLSSREFAAERILPLLLVKDEDFVGEARVFKGTIEQLEEIVKSNGFIVLKSPWSCSGRGVRFVEGALTESEKGWIKNVLKEQAVIMIEPKYNKVLDFAMEFMADKTAGTRFIGMNIFDTKNGAYLQNVRSKEEDKIHELSKFVDIKKLEIIKEAIIDITSREFLGRYSGPFGIDMMIVRDAENKTKVHPCVEMNLRRTMGQINLI